MPTDRMNFSWQLLAHSSSRFGVEAKSAGRLLAHLFRSRPRAILCGGYDSLAAWVCFFWCKLFRRRFVLWLESTARDVRRPASFRIA